MADRSATALEILVGGAQDDALELWMKYTPLDGTTGQTARLYYLSSDGTERIVTDAIPLKPGALDAFNPFAERRAGHIRLDDCDVEMLRTCFAGGSLPLVSIGGDSP